jgi:hypothetical protein
MVWVPPGSWEDAWSGKIITGPQRITVTAPVEQIPMYYRRGSLLITAAPAPTTAEQDWSHLFIEAFPGEPQKDVIESLFYDARTGVVGPVVHRVQMTQHSANSIGISVIAPKFATPRSWTVRVHPAPGTLFAFSKPHLVVADGAAVPIRIATSRSDSPSSPAIPFAGTAFEVDVPVGGSHEILFKW